MSTAPIHPLVAAATAGHVDSVVERLKGKADPATIGLALEMAAWHGHAGVVEILLDADVPKNDTRIPLAFAAMRGHLSCVKLLVGDADPNKSGSWPLQRAAEYNHVEVMRFLIPRSDLPEAGAMLIRDTEFKALDRLATVMDQMKVRKRLVSGWLDRHAQEMPVTQQHRMAQRRALARETNAGHLVEPSALAKKRATRVRC